VVEKRTGGGMNITWAEYGGDRLSRGGTGKWSLKISEKKGDVYPADERPVLTVRWKKGGY